MSNREQADITEISKRGEGYTIKGVANGQHATFHVDAQSLEKMSNSEAKEFMKRTIKNITHHTNE